MILLLTGTCGSGKTTIGRLLAESHGWHHISEDDYWRDRFHRARGIAGSEEHTQKRSIVRAALMQDVLDTLRSEQDVVIDATVHEASPDSLGEYAAMFNDAEIAWTMRVLHPRLEIAIQRDASRDGWRAGAEGVESLWRKFTGEYFAEHSFMDTSDESPEDTALRIVKSLEEDLK